MKKLIINCDDFGISKATNNAIVDCLRKKKASSTSIMPNGNEYLHAIQLIKKKIIKPKIGVHLNITEGKPINKRSFNFLTDVNNNFNIKPEMFFFYNYSKKKEIKKIIYLEFKAQIKKVLKSKIKISHLDSHQHIHCSPFIFSIVKKLSKEFKINRIRIVNEKFYINSFFSNFLFKLKNKNYFKFFLLKIYNYKQNKNKRYTDCFFGILNSGKIHLIEFLTYIDNLKNENFIELCIHPSNKSRLRVKAKYSKFYEDNNRYFEKKLLFSKKFKTELNKRNIKLLNYNEI